ncbi:hypothetical protein BO83DRAFT_155860 [Aspergillus eucalypticola CBS 122712]|uniref:Uncharacterized protein n=1 Tax=Aspergillus eucalypticola (strain CBS 122712 / IBT 29274) TaxID=1448314 RepID=A0A317UT30_ASPEC|nr:uncharacterized protein BO83DRAFT_155860 [Aspergillus eucalypticola CBS 122712]PWY63667.1 hypothetical protein BO83DRAFT_155860 [Aspergillus eucalypticola CBS 122712]
MSNAPTKLCSKTGCDKVRSMAPKGRCCKLTLLLFYSLAYMLTSNMIDEEDIMTVNPITSFAKEFIIDLVSSFTLCLLHFTLAQLSPHELLGIFGQYGVSGLMCRFVVLDV